METEVFREYAQIQEAARADPYSPYEPEQFEQGIEFLKRFARERGGLVRQYVSEIAPEILGSSAGETNDTSRFRSRQVRRPE